MPEFPTIAIRLTIFPSMSVELDWTT